MRNGSNSITARLILKKCFDTKIGALAFGDLEILSDLGRDIHTYVRTKKCQKNLFFGGVFRNQGVMKREEMEKKFFDFWTDYHIFRSVELLF